MLVVALIEDQQVIRRILEHVGLWVSEPPARALPLGPEAWPAYANLPLTYGRGARSIRE